MLTLVNLIPDTTELDRPTAQAFAQMLSLCKFDIGLVFTKGSDSPKLLDTLSFAQAKTRFPGVINLSAYEYTSDDIEIEYTSDEIATRHVYWRLIDVLKGVIYKYHDMAVPDRLSVLKQAIGKL